MATKQKDDATYRQLPEGGIAPNVESEDAPLSVDEAMRRFQGAVTDARRAQLEWIEKIGPPPGWKKLGPEDLRPGPMDSQPEEGDTPTMTDTTDYRHELALRDDQLRREMELRQESFRSEQALRDLAWSERFSGFLAQQAERDKRLDESVEVIRADIGKLGSLKANIWGSMLTAVAIGVAIAALGVSFYQTGKADKPTVQIVQPQTPAAVTEGAQK